MFKGKIVCFCDGLLFKHFFLYLTQLVLENTYCFFSWHFAIVCHYFFRKLCFIRRVQFITLLLNIWLIVRAKKLYIDGGKSVKNKIYYRTRMRYFVKNAVGY